MQVMDVVANIGVLSVVTILPISLLLLIFRKTRGWGGSGIYIVSWLVGLWVWLSCLVYAVSVSVFWAITGVALAGIGVVPVAMIMMVFQGNWSNLGALLINVLIVFALRFVGGVTLTSVANREC